MPPFWYSLVFQIFSFVLGAMIGSFLNVCIYRMPRDMAVNQPKRSFCPTCKTQIKWYHNLPIISWLWLRGKCAYCDAPISPRYLGVEFLTGCLFLAIYFRLEPLFSLPLLLPYWILAALLIVATFIDFDFFIIPDEITWGGVGAGIILSGLLPEMMGTNSRLESLGWSVCGAATGYFLLWGVVELGKLAFGRKKLTFPAGTKFDVKQVDDQPVLTVGEESMPWVDLFARESDRMILSVEKVVVDGKKQATKELVFFHDRLEIGTEKFPLADLDLISGEVSQIVIPREAMGFGDVKFIAAIGAFLGWQAVLFTVPVAAFCGSIIGVGSMLIGRREWSGKIPFGPYLALGGLVWMFTGPELVRWYVGLLGRAY
ncbi:MAG TPA: prepilin peptidase [Chthoniobacterales bacterium]